MAPRLLCRPPKPLSQVWNPAQGQAHGENHEDCEPRFENKTNTGPRRNPQEGRALTETRNAVSLGQNPHAPGVLGLPPAAAQTRRRASFPTVGTVAAHLPNPQAPKVTWRRGSLRDNPVWALWAPDCWCENSLPDTGHAEATQPRSPHSANARLPLVPSDLLGTRTLSPGRKHKEKVFWSGARLTGCRTL